MATPWDTFIHEQGTDLADLSLRQVLENYHGWLEAQGMFSPEDTTEPEEESPENAPAVEEDSPMFPAVLVTWTESERGWGQRPDGVSLHLTKEDAAAYIKAYWDRMPSREELGGEVPDEYTRNDNDGRRILVKLELQNKLSTTDDHSIRMGNQEFQQLQNEGHIEV